LRGQRRLGGIETIQRTGFPFNLGALNAALGTQGAVRGATLKQTAVRVKNPARVGRIFYSILGNISQNFGADLTKVFAHVSP
jgi:hypothetical protein